MLLRLILELSFGSDPMSPPAAPTTPAPAARPGHLEPMSYAACTVRQQLEQARMDAAGWMVMPYGLQPRKTKPSVQHNGEAA